MDELNFKSQRGASLIETLVMTGILVIVIQFIAQLMTNFRKFERHKRLKLNTLFIKSELNKFLTNDDCQNIRDALGGTCSDGDDIEIESASMGTLIEIPSNPNDFNDYSRLEDSRLLRRQSNYILRAKCRICPPQTPPHKPVCTAGDPIISIEALLVALDKTDPNNPTVRGKMAHYLGNKKITGFDLDDDPDWFPLYNPNRIPFKCGF